MNRRQPPTIHPPGVPETAIPYPGNMQRCPVCGRKRFDYMAEDYAACERLACGFTWRLTYPA